MLGDGAGKIEAIGSATAWEGCNLEPIDRSRHVGVVAKVQVAIPRVARLACPRDLEGRACSERRLGTRGLRVKVVAAERGAGVWQEGGWPG